AHIEAFRKLGYRCEIQDDRISIERQSAPQRELVMKEFSVTATENVLLASVLSDNALTVHCSAAEHVVQDLCWFLSAAGAKIEGIGTHRLAISGVRKLHGVEYTIMPDPVETGTFIALAAATHSRLAILNTAPEFLKCELSKFEEIGLTFAVENTRRDSLGNYTTATLLPQKKQTLAAIKKLHSMPYPGFAADLIQPFALLMTQAQGISLIHDWMYDGRLRYVSELSKMGANITIQDTHRILVTGPTPLYAKEITSYDLRAGATLVLAALIAEGRSVLHGIHQVDRGYEALDARLRSIGADIRRK
ncbi:MAG: UDP-N-acetylglucosamine 1-carboxyvinyltransferase, partial [Parcubacteria group bacterium]|nr:UDP-N-acetylglucosamine 1-carboxyvinyltransferase [Parcubacteria group bacterium]